MHYKFKYFLTKILLSILLSLIMMISIPACSKQKTTEPDAGNHIHQIIPLAIGNTWNYETSEVLYACEEGELECQPYPLNNELEHYITDSLQVDYEGENFPIFVSEDEIYAFQKFAIRNTADGLIEYGDIGGDQTIDYDPKLIVKYPISVGETWFDQDGFYQKQYRCISQNEEMTTPAGTFNCYVYELIDDQMEEGDFIKYYYAVDVGLIAEIRHRDVFFYGNTYYDIPNQFRDYYVKKLTSYSLH